MEVIDSRDDRLSCKKEDAGSLTQKEPEREASGNLPSPWATLEAERQPQQTLDLRHRVASNRNGATA